MFKIAFIFISSFWLSCGSTPQNKQTESIATNEELDTPAKEAVETVIVSATEEIKDSIKELETPQKEEVIANSTDELKDTNSVVIEEEIPTTIEEPKVVEEAVVLFPDHSKWNSLLVKYVNDKGDVDYKGFLKDASALNQYLDHLAENSPKKEWSKNEKLAYYINLYNAATIKLILDNYPTKSIKDIKNPWGKDWVKTGDGILSLGDIEHKILRKMNEPRIHFAINCASYSCPKLLNSAFTASKMETQLHETTLDFINDKTRNKISKENMQLSNIFKWYKKDFTENGSLRDYIKPYTTVEIDSDTDIDFLDYDWNLNEAR